MLSHRIRPVSEILAPHVEHLWVVRGYLAARWRNMILPDGAMELIVNLGDPQKLCAQDSPEKHTIFRHSWEQARDGRIHRETLSPAIPVALANPFRLRENGQSALSLAPAHA